MNLEKTLSKLNTPWKIQEYISKIPYNPGDDCRSAKRVFLERKAHCFEGALLASLALERLGHGPQHLHLRAHRDDDHVVALFREKSLWGAIGKSNTTLLSWRPAIYRNVQELVMSYFPFYFNTKGQMSLYSWAGPISLAKFKQWDWRYGAEDVGDMSAAFYDESGSTITSPKRIEKFPKAPELLTEACFLGANKKGLFQA
jgi:hypothetical protein